MKNLRYYLRPMKWMIMGGIAVKVAGSLLELLLPDILSHIIDDIVPSGKTDELVKWGAIMAVLSLLAWLFNIIANRNAAAVARNATRAIRHDLFEKTLYLTCARTDEYTIPSLESRLTSDTYNVHRMIGMMQRLGVRAPIITAGSLIIAFSMEPVLALVFLAVIPLMLLIAYLRASKGVPMFTSVQKEADRMTSVVRENAQGIRVIKALSRTDYEKNRFQKVNRALREKDLKANELMAAIDPLMNLFLYLGMIGVILLGAYRVGMGLTETGKIIAFMSYFQMISRSLMAAGRMFIMYSRGMASSERIMEVLNSESEKNLPVEEHPSGSPQAVIEFRDVSFSYLKVKDNLSHISFQLKKGESIGIIGATGSGKTTILSLLLRFYDVDEGAVFVNGKDVRSYPPEELRKMFGIVMQNDFIFNDTIAENIRFGRNVSGDDILDAEKTAQAYGFIHDLKEAENYVLTSKGTNLSGGQRQRILLSRAFASQPEFLLLDDSSSALDYKTDAELRKALEAKYPDVTKVIIAQRVSSIRSCSHILVMDHGRIAAEGTNDELLQSSPLYASIAESQMGGALFD